MEQISCLSACRIQRIEVGFDKMEQFGLVKKRIHLDGFDMDP